MCVRGFALTAVLLVSLSSINREEGISTRRHFSDASSPLWHHKWANPAQLTDGIERHNIVRKQNGSVGSIFSRARTAAPLRLRFIYLSFYCSCQVKNTVLMPCPRPGPSLHTTTYRLERVFLRTFGMRMCCCGRPGGVGDFQQLRWSFQPETPKLSVDQRPSTHTTQLQSSNHPSIHPSSHHPFFRHHFSSAQGRFSPVLLRFTFPNLRTWVWRSLRDAALQP